MANNQNLGFEHRFACVAAGGAMAGATQFDFAGSTVKKRTEVLEGAGLTGTRARYSTRTRKGVYSVGGTISMDITPRMLDFFLPYVLGAAEATDAFGFADSLSGFDMMDDPFGTGANAIKFGELYVNRFSLGLRGGPGGGILRAALDVMGKTYTTGQTFPAIALSHTTGVDSPYTFYDITTFTIGGAAVEVDDADLTIENGLDVKFRAGSRAASSIRATDQAVTLRINSALTSTSLGSFFDDKAAADVSIVINNGTVTTTFTLESLELADEMFETRGKGDVPLVLQGLARRDSANPAFQATVTGGSL